MGYTLHRARPWWRLEKWYSDAITPDGDVLVVLLAVIRVAGMTVGRVSADLSRANGPAVRGDAPASSVAAIPGLRLGPLRGLLRVLSRDPHQTRWAAPASLGGEAGWAVHEEVRWR